MVLNVITNCSFYLTRHLVQYYSQLHRDPTKGFYRPDVTPVTQPAVSKHQGESPARPSPQSYPLLFYLLALEAVRREAPFQHQYPRSMVAHSRITRPDDGTPPTKLLLCKKYPSITRETCNTKVPPVNTNPRLSLTGHRQGYIQ